MPPSDLTVALVSTQRHWHGGEEQARLLAVGLRRRGCRCVVLARRGGAFAAAMEAEGFDVSKFAGNGRNPAALWQMRRALRRLRPDVLHYNDSHAIQGAGMASLGMRVPARIAARRVDFPLRSARPYRWFCDRVVCVSQAVRRVCRDGGLPETMLRVVHDGVDPGRVARGDRQRGRKSLGLSDSQPLLVCIAKLTDHKGHRFLLEALPAVIQKTPGVAVALAGDGELRESLERQAEQLGVSSHLRFLGFCDDVPDLIHAADLFVLPSYMEGLCSTLIDVMLAGRTIVTTTAGGIPDLVGSDEHRDCPEFRISENGTVPFSATAPVAWTVPPRDPKALAEAILDALASPEKCAGMQQRARRRAEDRFTADCMVEGTLAVYREAMSDER
jgi:glycosyltransferase involved in cell wall biosynthesis